MAVGSRAIARKGTHAGNGSGLGMHVAASISALHAVVERSVNAGHWHEFAQRLIYLFMLIGLSLIHI